MDSLFGALADPTRIAVVQQLASGTFSVGQLAEPFDMALPSFMQHLRVLEDAGLIITRKEGRRRLCSLNAPTLRSAERWLHEQHTVWSQRLNQLDDYLIALNQAENDPNRL